MHVPQVRAADIALEGDAKAHDELSSSSSDEEVFDSVSERVLAKPAERS